MESLLPLIYLIMETVADNLLTFEALLNSAATRWRRCTEFENAEATCWPAEDILSHTHTRTAPLRLFFFFYCEPEAHKVTEEH